ncbi:hypothetical protein NKH47_17850 [Mesorhizobium sp. M1060]|uniref:hypothetical protein n=1 Tax=unclassified Mesorhizobium TaxID=325217 RepID=UPI0003CE4F1A|nr:MULTISPECIES: hypothetical protein [unclassified Mesorhizobium]ESX32874.1 hypothetical protein X765_03790 [Mesorhizobium sp. LSHC440B00]ESX40056.1 hypothetical protein X763_04630 [Mesorhizobium sp. LSHC432A00]ESX44950.1 hypothetical protein X764_03645 [Mesorhizobium sp. LSHC440A00]WJI59308.1 hypothetical protein NLY33_11605 [Mesorhizobium sp. C432A]
MKEELDRSKASFKLDLIETANIDPTLTPADFKVLAAYVAVMAWPSCKTWLASTRAQALTGLGDRQFRISRGRLLGKNDAGRAYLTPAKSGGKVSTYRLINPWRDEARQHADAMTSYHKEVERQKKATKRADLSLQNLPGQNPVCPGKICRSVPAKSAAYSPSMITPREEGAVDNEHGSNVVPFNKRRAS